LPIEALLFDLGRVLIDFEFDHAFRPIEQLSGLSREEIQRRLMRDALVVEFETGKVGEAEFIAEANRRLATSLGSDAFAEIWNAIFTGPLVPEALIRGLSSHYRLVLVSNTNAIHFSFLKQRLPHLSHFHELVLSHEAGCIKPYPEIYKAAVEKAGCAATACLFFDDLAENIEGARAAGLNAEQFVGHAELLAALGRYGVTVD
jgi:putative hydrolase of the HAD superfamily